MFSKKQKWNEYIAKSRNKPNDNVCIQSTPRCVPGAMPDSSENKRFLQAAAVSHVSFQKVTTQGKFWEKALKQFDH